MSTTVELYKLLDAMEKAERQLEAADRLADAVFAGISKTERQPGVYRYEPTALFLFTNLYHAAAAYREAGQ